MSADLTRWLEAVRAEVDALLAERLGAIAGGRLAEAMRYAVLGPPGASGGGKRLRPAVCLAVAEGLGGPEGRRRALPSAAAVELVHAYSLVHDDLPSMDDDRLRRGQPATHVAFGPATAARAGVALQAIAFRTIAAPHPGAPSASARAELVRILAEAAGPAGLVGGQWLDLETAGEALPAARIEEIHARKTGALFRAAAEMAAVAAGAPRSSVEAAARFGAAFGLAFQMLDDLVDSTPQAAGEAAARATLDTLRDEALALAHALDPRPDSPLAAIARQALRQPARASP